MGVNVKRKRALKRGFLDRLLALGLDRVGKGREYEVNSKKKLARYGFSC